MGVFRLKGLIAAAYTAFDADGNVNLDAIERQAESLIGSGVTGAFICGSTGEGLSMTIAERKEVAHRWVRSAGNRLPVIVHVGHVAQREAIALAKHAGEIGASAIAALPPFYYKPENASQLVSVCEPIAGATNLPFYYYHVPSMTGVRAPMVEFLSHADRRIPNFNGIKFTDPNLMEYQCCRAFADGKFDIAWGVDEMLLGALAMGADAAVGSTYNYAAPLYLRMMKAFAAGDIQTARAQAQRVVELVGVLLKYGVMRTGKATMNLLDIDCGPTRPPIAPMNSDVWCAVQSEYQRLGLMDLWNVANR